MNERFFFSSMPGFALKGGALQPGSEADAAEKTTRS
jgi:hypothetical protein